MTSINECLREHVTSAAFVLTLGKTHVAALVRLDLELAADILLDYATVRGSYGALHRCDVGALNGLISRGLVVHVWEKNKHKHQIPDRSHPDGWRWDGIDDRPRCDMWNITHAGRLVCDLLKEAGIYQEHAGILLPLIDAARQNKRRRSA